ncbi:MAG: M3 family oligoendopeptidase [Nitrososphaerota archaeon]|nr:M3 family oligoendopeptidase [Nitrososphaerota archaeon]
METVEVGRWRLGDILPSKEELGPAMDGLRAELREFGELKAGLNSLDGEGVSKAFRRLEGIYDSLSRLSSYAYMLFSEDTRDERNGVALSQMDDLQAQAENDTLFFKLWWIGLPEERSSGLLPPGQDAAYYLGRLRARKPHTLEEDVEKAINVKNTTGVSGWIRHYEQLTSEFTYTLRVDGRTVKGDDGRSKRFVTEELVRLAFDQDPRKREACYRTLFARYARYGRHLGEIYRNIVKDWANENLGLRHYAKAISVRNLDNDLPDDAVETLMSVCRRNSGVFQEFFRHKAELLHMKKMSRYHIYAPVGGAERKLDYREAIGVVFKAFDSFDAGFASLAKKVFLDGHVDSQRREGKLSGAYCSGVAPGVTPYILLTYSGSTRDVYTVAHESGHAVHDQLASSHSPLTYSPPLVLAETASVFGEMILYDHLMEEETGGREKLAVEKLSEMYATIQRQVYFAVFEVAAHEAFNHGGTVDDVCGLYLENLKEQFGDAVDIPDEFRWEWTYIPHIYRTPFYCYAYSFGNLLTLALYRVYKRRGKSFVPDYLKMLSYGGSASPRDVLSEMGIDIASADFWQGGYDTIRDMVGRLGSG